MADIRKRNYKRLGAATVEAAIIFPLLILLTFGAIKYGWLFLKAQQITNAARYGARLAIVPDADLTQIQETIWNMLEAESIPRDSVSITVTPSDISDLGIGDSIQVRVTVPGQVVDIMEVPLFPEIGTLGATVTMAKEGF